MHCVVIDRYFVGKALWVAVLLSLVSACTSSDDDGGLIGTGSGVIESSGIPVYHGLTASTPTTQEPVNGGDVMNLGPIPGTCPSLLRSVQIERDSGWSSPSNELIGNWLGTTSEGSTIIVVITEDDIAHGNRTASISLRSNTALEITYDNEDAGVDSSPAIFSYSVTAPADGNSQASIFYETYELVSDNSLVYTIESEQFDNDSVQLDRANPVELFRPPLWAQGLWVNACETRTISENGIHSMSALESEDLGMRFSGESSTFRVHYIDENSYRYSGTFKTEDGTHLRVSEEYELISPDVIRIVSGDIEKEMSRN